MDGVREDGKNWGGSGGVRKVRMWCVRVQRIFDEVHGRDAAALLGGGGVLKHFPLLIDADRVRME